MMSDAVLTFDGPRDGLGRRRFTMEWTEPNGDFRPERHFDGKPVGYRRGQCFCAVPDTYVQRVIESGGRVIDEIHP